MSGINIGAAVSISGDRAVVLANGAEIYLRSGEEWSVEEGILGFSNAISLDNDYLALSGIGANEASVLKREGSSWVARATVTASDSEIGDELALRALSISGNFLIAGAPFHDVGTNEDQGAAYIFVNNN